MKVVGILPYYSDNRPGQTWLFLLYESLSESEKGELNHAYHEPPLAGTPTKY
jgi:hypothetical protein